MNKYNWFVSKIYKLEGIDLYYFLTDFSTYLDKMNVTVQQEGKALLEPIARTNSTWYVKFGAFKAISKLTKIEDRKFLLNDINEKEKDEKVKKYFARVLGK